MDQGASLVASQVANAAHAHAIASLSRDYTAAIAARLDALGPLLVGLAAHIGLSAP